MKVRKKVVITLIVNFVCLHFSFGQQYWDIEEMFDIFTPMGSLVSTWVYSRELTDGDRKYWDDADSSSYPNAEMITVYDGFSSTRKFNCHGYAWIRTEGGPDRWLCYDDPEIYMTDGSYVEVPSETYPGKVFWERPGDHSAITTEQPGWFISKWNFRGLFKHRWDDSPYGSTGLKYYVRGKADVVGTVFPFIHKTTPGVMWDTIFPVTAKLYNYPTTVTEKQFVKDTLGIKSTLLRDSTTAYYYDGTEYVPKTPKNPGKQGFTNNPGKPILWWKINKTKGIVNNDTVTVGQYPVPPVGIYKFMDVPSGRYVLELSRAGYLVRYGKVIVNGSASTIVLGLGHRELLPGDVNDDMVIDSLDTGAIMLKSGLVYGGPGYESKYDVNSNLEIDNSDASLVKFYKGADIEIYEDTDKFLNHW